MKVSESSNSTPMHPRDNPATTSPHFSSPHLASPLALTPKVDVDELREASSQFDVKSLPTFVFLKGGKEVSRFEGASMQLLKQNVQQHI